MTKPGIRLTRYPYEEPYHLNLQIEASNGRFQGKLDYYCVADDLGVIGNKLVAFSGKPGEFVYELGAENPKANFAFFLSLRVRTLDTSGHCSIVIRMNNNQPSPDTEETEFSIRADVADVNRLGKLLIGFGRLEHRCLEWLVHEGRLIEGFEEVV